MVHYLSKYHLSADSLIVRNDGGGFKGVLCRWKKSLMLYEYAWQSQDRGGKRISPYRSLCEDRVLGGGEHGAKEAAQKARRPSPHVRDAQ